MSEEQWTSRAGRSYVERPRHDAYERVRGHSKLNCGFWLPDHPLSTDEVGRVVTWARQLSGPSAAWYRCQELAQVAQQVGDPELRADLLREAFANADRQEDANRIVTVASWPLRTLLDTGEPEWFARETHRLLPIILREPNPFRRQDGLFALLFVDAPRPCFDRVLSLYCEACADLQKVLTMRRVAVYINPRDHAKAIEVCLLIREPRRRRQALRAIDEGP